MSLDEDIKLCDIVGKIGKYQISLTLINFSTAALAGLCSLTVVLLAPEVSIYWDWEASSPNKTVFRSTNCKMDDITEHNRTSNISSSSSKLIYESQYSKRTLTEELNLVCERSWLVSLANFMILFGIVFGSIILGRLSEIFGRKPCTIWTIVITILSSTSILFTQGYIMLMVSVFIYGATAFNASIFIFIEVLEIVPNSWSQYAGTFSKSGLLFGQTMFVGIAWILKDWFYIQIFQIAYAGFIFLILLYTLESPMWLAVRRKYIEAKNTILKIIKRNNLKREELEEKIDNYIGQIKIRCEIQGTAEKGKYSDLFKNRVITLYTVAMCMTRIGILFIYQSLMMNVESFGSGLYVDLSISNAVSFASIMMALILIKKFSIRVQMVGFCFCTGVVCAVFPLVYEFPLARSALSILGRCFISPPICVSFVYLTEVYPTSLRGVATGFIVMVGGVVSSLSPFTKELGEMTAIYVPFILFAVLGFIAAGLYAVMPETKGKELIHTVDELLERKRESATRYAIPPH